MDAIKICQECGLSNMVQQTECYSCGRAEFSKTYYAKELPKAAGKESNSTPLLCTWTKAFDGHFNLGCAGETGQRGNGRFIGKATTTTWHFTYCPYCGRKIELVE
jgi:hypothetical protein